MTSTAVETDELPHGYTVTDIDRIARDAVSRARRNHIDFRDRYDAAWHAIAVTLYDPDATGIPTPDELFEAGRTAISAEFTAAIHHHGALAPGLQAENFDNQRAPKFMKFWRAATEPVDFTDRLVERLAIPQILAQLSERDIAVLYTLADWDTVAEAAAAFGVSERAFFSFLQEARDNFIYLWTSPETAPRRISHLDKSRTTCKYGHSRAEHEVATKNGSTRCQVCNRNHARRYRARNPNYRSTEVIVDVPA